MNSDTQTLAFPAAVCAELSSFDLAVLMAVYVEARCRPSEYAYISTVGVAAVVFNTHEVEMKTQHYRTKKAIKDLIERGYIPGVFISSDCVAVQSAPVSSFAPPFCMVDVYNVYSILQSGQKNRFDILRYFLFLMTTRSTKNKCRAGNMSAEYVASKLGLSLVTIYRYSKILEDAHIIYVKHAKVPHQKNAYGEYDDREVVENWKFAVTESIDH